jgi:hypothetical protein
MGKIVLTSLFGLFGRGRITMTKVGRLSHFFQLLLAVVLLGSLCSLADADAIDLSLPKTPAGHSNVVRPIGAN